MQWKFLRAAGCLLWGVTLFATLGCTAAKNIYVSPAGDDSYSGLISAPNPKRTDGPLASLAGARDAIRKLRAQGKVTGPVRVIVGDGTYGISEALVFTSEDSGTEEAPITYEAAPGARPVISGGRSISGFKRAADGKIWVAKVPDASNWRFRQLFIDGVRGIRARRPNREDYWFHIEKQLEPLKRANARFRKGDIKAWPRLREIECVLLRIWNISRFRIESVDEKNCIVKMHTGRDRASMRRWRGDKRYYLENAFAFLDAPGEWYLDVEKGLLYVIPFDDKAFPSAEVVAPAVERLIHVEGTAEKPVRWIRFKGLTFRHASWSIEESGYNGHQGDLMAGGSLAACYYRDGGFENCRFEHLGKYGLWLARGCQRNVVTACEFADLGGGAVMVGEKWIPEKAGDEVTGIRVVDNHIQHTGKVWHGSVGIILVYASHCQVARNHVHDTPYTGISVGWGWADKPNPSHHNTIAHNHVHDVMRLMGDGGCIYTLGRQPGTVIRNNVLHDTFGWYTYGPGIYLDGASAEITVESNLVARTLGASLVMHSGGRHTIRNNIFALAATGTFHPSGTKGSTMTNNIIYVREGYIFGKRWDEKTAKSDRNLYFIDNSEIPLEFPGGRTLREWRNAGQDGASVVADPLFRDVDGGDFKLKPNSPALNIGFKPFKIPVIGPQKENWRADPRMVELFTLDQGKSRRKKRTHIPRLEAVKIAHQIAVDGKAGKNEWDKIAPVPLLNSSLGKAAALEEKSTFRVAHDGGSLYVLVENKVADARKLKAAGHGWGAHDGLEVCFQDISSEKAGYIFDVRGYASGYLECEAVADTPVRAAKLLREAIKYKASVAKDMWIAEFAILLAGAGIDAKNPVKLAFNICVRRARRHVWVFWVDTEGPAWHVYNAGELVLAR